MPSPRAARTVRAVPVDRKGRVSVLKLSPWALGPAQGHTASERGEPGLSEKRCCNQQIPPAPRRSSHKTKRAGKITLKESRTAPPH